MRLLRGDEYERSSKRNKMFELLNRVFISCYPLYRFRTLKTLYILCVYVIGMCGRAKAHATPGKDDCHVKIVSRIYVEI